MDSAQAPSLRRLASNVMALPPEHCPAGQKGVILETAMRLFAERNYAGASMRDIAAAVNLKPASLYAHFKSKEQMLASLIEIGHREHHQATRAAVLAANNDSVSRLSAWVEAHVRFHGSYPMLSTVINHELHALPATQVQAAQTLRDQVIQMLNDLLKQGQQEGVFRFRHDIWLASAAIGAMGMRVAHWFNEDQPHELGDVARAYVDFSLQICGVDFSGE